VLLQQVEQKGSWITTVMSKQKLAVLMHLMWWARHQPAQQQRPPLHWLDDMKQQQIMTRKLPQHHQKQQTRVRRLSRLNVIYRHQLKVIVTTM
jgi:hypothetical protein